MEQFLAGRIKFGNIVELVRHCLDNSPSRLRAEDATLAELLEADNWAKKEVMEWLKERKTEDGGQKTEGPASPKGLRRGKQKAEAGHRKSVRE